MDFLLPHIPSLIAYLLGLISGLSLRSLFDLFNKRKDSQEEFGKTLILFIVVFVWLAATVIDWVDTDYQTPIAIHVIMGSVVGFHYNPIDLSSILTGKKKNEK